MDFFTYHWHIIMDVYLCYGYLWCKNNQACARFKSILWLLVRYWSRKENVIYFWEWSYTNTEHNKNSSDCTKRKDKMETCLEISRKLYNDLSMTQAMLNTIPIQLMSNNRHFINYWIKGEFGATKTEILGFPETKNRYNLSPGLDGATRR